MATTVEILSRVATRPTWAEVSLTALRQNFRTVVKHAGAGVTVCAVVKADAYGHGAVECSRALQEEGAKWLGVTSLDEAIPLREAGIEPRILLMTGFWRGEESEIVRLRLTPTVWEPWHIESLENAAASAAVRHAVHLKVDTGMGRLGVSLDELPDNPENLEKLARRLSCEPGSEGSAADQFLSRLEEHTTRIRELFLNLLTRERTRSHSLSGGEVSSTLPLQ